jgi:hypothetical protein
MNIVVTPDTGFMNISPDGFHKWATEFIECRKTLNTTLTKNVSPVAYYLLCHAIELEIKARLLRSSNNFKPRDLKNQYGHRLIDAYNALDTSDKVLTKTEIETLKVINQIYKDKGFEYFTPVNVFIVFQRLLDIKLLDHIASKLIETLPEKN